LNPDVAKASERVALGALRYGHSGENPEIHQRAGNRWQGKAETALLNDFDFIVQALFADQSKITLQSHNKLHEKNYSDPPFTKLQKLSAIWKRVLPRRELILNGDTIRVSAPGEPSNAQYSAADMSDGERAVFYLLGQALVAEPNSILIFDEPELHIHRSILGSLWDEVEAARPDCAFLVITHDLEFAASRPGLKYFITDYTTHPAPAWTIELVPAQDGFSEETATLILGSRKPVLFVEGEAGSLDMMLYRELYPTWTVIPRGPCDNVIHSVQSMRDNASFTRMTCSGLVDRDGRDEAQIEMLTSMGVAVLPVAEIENLFALPGVMKAVAALEGYSGHELDAKLAAVEHAILSRLDEPGVRDGVVLRRCRRHVDRELKTIDLKGGSNVAETTALFGDLISKIDIAAVATETEDALRQAISQNDLPALLAIFDDKQLLSTTAKILTGKSKGDFVKWVGRVLKSTEETDTNRALHKQVRDAISGYLPALQPA